MTNGWYLYCLVFPELILLCAGLIAIAPQRCSTWIPASLAAQLGAGWTAYLAATIFAVGVAFAVRTPDERQNRAEAPSARPLLPEIGGWN